MFSNLLITDISKFGSVEKLHNFYRNKISNFSDEEKINLMKNSIIEKDIDLCCYLYDIGIRIDDLKIRLKKDLKRLKTKVKKIKKASTKSESKTEIALESQTTIHWKCTVLTSEQNKLIKNLEKFKKELSLSIAIYDMLSGNNIDKFWKNCLEEEKIHFLKIAIIRNDIEFIRKIKIPDLNKIIKNKKDFFINISLYDKKFELTKYFNKIGFIDSLDIITININILQYDAFKYLIENRIFELSEEDLKELFLEVVDCSRLDILQYLIEEINLNINLLIPDPYSDDYHPKDNIFCRLIDSTIRAFDNNYLRTTDYYELYELFLDNGARGARIDYSLEKFKNRINFACKNYIGIFDKTEEREEREYLTLNIISVLN